MYARDIATLDPNSVMNALPSTLDRLPGLQDKGVGSKILRVTAFMLEKDSTWPGKLCTNWFLMGYETDGAIVTHLMANALQVHAGHMDQRAEASLTAS